MARRTGPVRRCRWLAAACGLAAAGLPLVQFLPVGQAATRRLFWHPNPRHGLHAGWSSLLARRGDLSLVRHPVRDGLYTYRFVVHPGDFLNDGQRSELSATQAQTGGYPGVQTWYAWSVYFPANYNPTPDAFNIFTQWHQTGISTKACRPGPNIAFRTSDNTRPLTLQMVVTGGPIPSGCHTSHIDIRLGTLTFDRWIDFTFHVMWSPNPAIGFVQVFMDGQQVVPITHLATMYPNDGVFVKQGIYRAPSDRVSTLYEDAIRRGATKAAVQLPSRRR
jgi:hypothetical protein